MNNLQPTQEPEEEPGSIREKDIVSRSNQIPLYRIPSYIVEGAKTSKSPYRYQPEKEVIVVPEGNIDELYERISREEAKKADKERE